MPKVFSRKICRNFSDVLISPNDICAKGISYRSGKQTIETVAYNISQLQYPYQDPNHLTLEHSPQVGVCRLQMPNLASNVRNYGRCNALVRISVG